jgi:subtilisin family serine protease/subtilisin-like proprotein convertase family protein
MRWFSLISLRVVALFSPRRSSRRSPLLGELGDPVKLESRELLTASTTSAANYFWGAGQKVFLEQAATEVAVQLTQSSSKTAEQVYRQFSSQPHAGFGSEQSIGGNIVLLKRDQLPAADLRRAAVSAVNSSGAQAAFASPVLHNPQNGDRLIPTQEIIVGLKPGQSAARLFTRANGYESFRALRGTTDQFVVTVSGTAMDAWNKANTLQESGVFAYATQNMLVQQARNEPSASNLNSPTRSSNNTSQNGTLLTNDPLINSQWHLNNTGQGGGRIDADADVFEAWNDQTGSDQVVIAVFDDGIDLQHPDLIQNLFVNEGEIPGNNIDDDGNGWIDDRFGLDVSYNPATPVNYDGDPTHEFPWEGHGTAVAGVIAARGDNGIGVSGVSQRSKILPIKISDTDQNGFFVTFSPAAIAEAVYYAGGRTANGTGTWRGADITNHSWGGSASQGAALQAAFLWASTQGRGGLGQAQFVSSGNSFATAINFPARYPGAIAVGASTDGDVRSAYSNYGPELSVVAPSSGGASGITTTDPRGPNGYSPNEYSNDFGGTSSAAPLVAGIAALMLSKNPFLTAAQIRSIIEDTADQIGGVPYDASGRNPQYGHGRVNASAALAATQAPEAEITVRDGTINLTSGTDTLNIGTVGQGNTPPTKTLTIRNDGSENLILQAATITGSGFSITTNVANGRVLAPSASTTIVVRLDSTTAGFKSAQLAIPSNDRNENPFRINLSGIVNAASAPDIALYEGSTSLTTGNTYSFGSHSQGSSTNTRQFFIRNTGNSALVLQPATLAGSGFAITQNVQARQTVSPGGSAVISVRMSTNTLGSKTAVLSIPSNDPDESPFRINLSGTVSATSLGSLSGIVFGDTNGDGIVNGGEAGIANRTVFIDLNGNGLFDQSGLITTNVAATGLPVPINDLSTIVAPLTVTGANGSLTDINVQVNIAHPFAPDIEMTLIAPNGQRIALAFDRGGNGGDFNNTIFDDQATTAISAGAAPFTGSFRPEQPLSVLNGTNPNGTWGLEITDDFANDAGTLNSWSLNITSAGSAEPSQVTTAGGNYAFTGLSAGPHQLRQVLPTDWVQTGPNNGQSHNINLAAGQNSTGNNFGSRLGAPANNVTILDDGDAGFSVAGTWSTVTGGFSNDRRLASAGNGNATASWNFTGLASGRYSIAATWIGAANRASNIPYTVQSTAASPILLSTTIDQRSQPASFVDSGTNWQTLGTVTVFGNSLLVTAANTTTGLITADAIRLERLGNAIAVVDDGDAGFSLTGNWSTATSGFGNDRRLAAAGSGTAVATWSFSNLAAGQYRISATWNNPATNRANDAPYSIRETSSGPSLLTATVNQRLAPSGFSEGGVLWQDLGTVIISGDSLVIRLSNSTTGLVTADAIRIERIS